LSSFISNNPRSLIKLAKKSGSFEDPDAWKFFGGHLDSDDEIGGLASCTEHTGPD